MTEDNKNHKLKQLERISGRIFVGGKVKNVEKSFHRHRRNKIELNDKLEQVLDDAIKVDY